MTKHFDKLAYQIDRLKNRCPGEIMAWVRDISESDGALYANASIINSLAASPLAAAAMANLKSKVLKRGRISTFDISCLELMIRCRRDFDMDTSELIELRRKWAKKASKKNKQNLKMHAAGYRQSIINWLQSPGLSKSEKRDKALFSILIFIPLRIQTLHLLEKSQFDAGILFVTAEQMKNRKAISPRLPALAQERLNEYLSARTDDLSALFAAAGGKEIAQNSLQRTIRRRTEKLLGVALGPHDFRRIVATTTSAISQDAAAALLVISHNVLRKHYDLNDSTDRINHALARIGE